MHAPTQFKQLTKWVSVGRGGIVANRRGNIPASAHLSNFPKRAFFSLGIQLLLVSKKGPVNTNLDRQLDPMRICFYEGLCTPYTILTPITVGGKVDDWPQVAIGFETPPSKRSSVVQCHAVTNAGMRPQTTAHIEKLCAPRGSLCSHTQQLTRISRSNTMNASGVMKRESGQADRTESGTTATTRRPVKNT
jgi:hypothetical protein